MTPFQFYLLLMSFIFSLLNFTLLFPVLALLNHVSKQVDTVLWAMGDMQDNFYAEDEDEEDDLGNYYDDFGDMGDNFYTDDEDDLNDYEEY